MRLKTINRTSTFAWSPVSVLPFLATGTVAGALDENFSNEGRLELWEPDFLSEGEESPKGSVTTTSRFNRLAWGHVTNDRPKGVIAAGMESGELGIWDPAKIVESADPSDSLILSNKKHQTSLRGLDFNSVQTNLLASGASAGEIYIWDLTNPTKPYTPTGTTTANSKLDLITSLAWNSSVAHVLASSSSTGYTVVWDLRGRREVVALAYGGGAATGGGAVAGGMEIGRRRGMSDVCWHPDNPTRLVTSSEDDTSPIIMLWDLRNSRAPEKILTGHEKGVLSVSWCKQDADLLLSCGKDNRSLCWNPQVGEIIGELPSSNNWAFQVDWCPRNPDLLATASFDGTIGLHMLQSTNEDTPAPSAAAVQADGADIFDLPAAADQPKTTLSLKQPPKWLRRPTSSSFGFGGKLVSLHNSTQAVQHGHGKGIVKLRTIVTEDVILERLEKLQQAEAEGPAALQAFVEDRTGESTSDGDVKDTWRALASLFRADNRDELITLLGFSKEEIKERVKEAVEKLKIVPATSPAVREASEAVSEPTVTFAEPEHDQIDESEGPQDTEHEDTTEAPSEVSVGATSIGTKATAAQTEADTETTEPSLFGEDIGAVAPGGAGTPATADPADFFSTIGTIRSALPERVLYPHHNYANDSSQAATVGSRSSSIADLNDAPSRAQNTFKIYPSEESEVDRLVTRALVLGDFASAVQLCLSAERFADAILLAVKGGPELLASTQKAYFEKRVTELPYLRLFQSIVSDDLTDIVQNADLREWKEIFVVLCTFAKSDDFGSLTEQLGQRLEFQGRLVGDDEKGKKELRKDATLCYLAAGKLEKIVGIWSEEMKEEEEAAAQTVEGAKQSTYDAHAAALQTFIEKVTVFRGATSYVDTELTQPTESAAVAESGARTYKLAALYDRYYEYADLISSQGLVSDAVKYVTMTPADYRGVPGVEVEFDVIRDRLLQAANVRDDAALWAKQHAKQTVVSAGDPGYFPKGLAAASAPAGPGAPSQPAAAPTYNPYGYAQNGAQAVAPSVANPYAPVAPAGYQPGGGPVPPPKNQPYPPSAPMQYPSNSYGGAPYGQPTYQPGAPQSIVPPPPPVIDEPSAVAPDMSGMSSGPPRGLSIKREATPGWNDAPTIAAARRAASATAPANAPPAITAPFPNSPVAAGPASPYAHPVHQTMVLPPPPSRGSAMPPAQAGGLPPPPQRGIPPPPRNTASPQIHGPPPQRSGPPGAPAPPGAGGRPLQPPPAGRGPAGPGYPPQRAMSPLAQGTPRAPPMRALSPPQQAQGPPRIPPGQPRMQAPPPGRPANGAMAGQPGLRPAPPSGGQWPSQTTGTPQPPPSQSGAYGPPSTGHPPAPPSQMMSPPSGQPPQLSRSSTPGSAGALPKPAAPQPPKYPPGDRSHIPPSLQPIHQLLVRELEQMKATTPPQQKRVVDDTERRLNNLFDALNCETLSAPVLQQLQQLIGAMQARELHSAMNTHVRLLTSGIASDNVAIWGPGIKQLLNRMGR
ncbi:hypothetical protein CALVIDRAFT_567736 [Calocera viscosa TUFC12733]|uniref:Protein transport protein SEC31 n=1 Tax=Calocera viscosa (strain TUFC12733) TaxID=1330018 RepID=A0A167HUH4_CALVF|nr:hypothetical protein CALVIDRAFT_567736 [Calocera viscosa TUFC12733]